MLVYHGWFELVFNLLRSSSDSSRKQLFGIFKGKFLISSWKCMFCVLIKIAPSNEYTKHTIILQKIEKTSQNHPHMPPESAFWLILCGLNCPCLERIFVAIKTFGPYNFDCILLLHLFSFFQYFEKAVLVGNGLSWLTSGTQLFLHFTCAPV